VIVDDNVQQKKIEEIKQNLPALKFIIQIANIPSEGTFIVNWSDLLKMNLNHLNDEYLRRIECIKPNDCCCILYTSGTTGLSKGALLSHDNLTSQALLMNELLPSIDEHSNHVVLSYLPLSHGAAFMEDIYIAIQVSAAVYFADISALKTSLLQTLLDTKPTVFMGVPRVFEKIEQKMKENFSLLSVCKQKLLSWSQSVTLHYYLSKNRSLIDSCKYKIACKFFHSKIRTALGFSNTKAFICGSAPLNEETKRFFMSIDMPLVECYGMTESSTVHSMVPMKTPMLTQSVGKALKFMQTKIIDVNAEGEGEFCLKGRHVFMGYLNNFCM
jgi:long-chain-fatty-acid--CoA ligase ACSBG